jgi:hypothetical protein
MFEIRCFYNREILCVEVSGYMALFVGAYCLPVQAYSLLVQFPERLSYNKGEQEM